MIKPVFNITGSAIDGDTCGQSILLMEVNETSFSYVILGPDSKLLVAAYYVLTHAEGRNLTEAIRQIVDGQDILQQEFRQAIVVYNFSETTLVPAKWYHHEVNRDLIELLFGNLKKGLVLSEQVNAFELHTIYRIPAAVHSLLQQKFSAGKYWHVYTLWLQTLQKLDSQEAERIHLVFAADKVLVAVFKNQQLQLLQSFAYTTPEDVVYHLLHCCQQLSLSQEDCILRIGGYIDEDSALFNEIKKYFLKIEFDKVEGADEVSPAEYPAHYFSYLQKLALCV